MAKSPDSFVVLDFREMPSADPARMGQYDCLVTWELAPGVRGVVRIPKEEYDEKALVAAVKAQMEERGKWVNRSFRL